MKAAKGIRVWPGVLLVSCLAGLAAAARAEPAADAGSRIEADFRNPPEAARPWVYWYWMNAAVTREGITADLEAMKRDGIRMAYLMPIKGADSPPLVDPPAEQLSPVFWDRIRDAMSEADRLGIKLAMHACDGFSIAGGPWITPEQSMQKVVWSEMQAQGGRRIEADVAEPQSYKGFYRDIALLAFPTPACDIAGDAPAPTVTSSVPGADAAILAAAGNQKFFESKDPCWIEFSYAEPFTCRSIVIRPGGVNVGNGIQGNRLLVEASDDGVTFRRVTRLEPPRQGWQDGDADVTHAIPATTARHFRFMYDPEGSAPGSEDLDAAKWRQSLKLQGIVLSGRAAINQFEGKNGEVWRVSLRTSDAQVPPDACVPLSGVMDLSGRMDSKGHLAWDAPPGNWTVMRIGHTSTGHMNETGGGGKGLECDKFSSAAARVQFDHWFAEAFRQAGPELAGRVLKVFHIDSWECGSQNWTGDFREEFERRRGYDPLRYLPAMAGVPIQSADVSERFLHDVRQTVAELVVDRFYGTMAALAHAKGCTFSAESVAATFTSDGMLHFSAVDYPMGEFWLRSPTHDKQNDVLDAVSGAHTYGRAIAQSEAFTEIRLFWDEDPALMKPVADRNYSFGMNRFVFHVFTHNPWMDRHPGMTLNGVGSFFQRDQTWWRPGRAWFDYAGRCQAVLQEGRPVVDVAVFTGEEIPRRAVIPEQLIGTLPGVIGADVVAREKARLANVGQPLAEMPIGVFAGANISKPADWVDPLHGYAYDSINADALLRLASVKGGRIVLPGGASYAVLVLPGPRPLSPYPEAMTPEIASRVRDLVKAGATVVMCERPVRSPSLSGYPDCDAAVDRIGGELWPGSGTRSLGLGRVVAGPWQDASFSSIGIEPDCVATELGANQDPADVRRIAWTHREDGEADVYFISNQDNLPRDLEISLRVSGRVPEIWDPVTRDIRTAGTWRIEAGRTVLPLRLPPCGSVFVVLRTPTGDLGGGGGPNWDEPAGDAPVAGPWTVAFDPASGGPPKPVVMPALVSWSSQEDPGVRYYSGTAKYSATFTWERPRGKAGRVWLDVGRVANLAEVTVNGVDCGVAWTAPYRVDVTAAVRPGSNDLAIDVTNTWANRLIGDHALPPEKRVSFMRAPYRLEGQPLLEAGLLGPVSLLSE
jgi:hypothetical protein